MKITLAGVGTTIGGVGALLGGLGSGGRKLTEEEKMLLKYQLERGKESYAKLPGLESQLMAPVNMSEVNSLAPMAMKAIAPQLKQLTRKAGAKFGVRSGMALGSVATTGAQSLAGQIANFYRSAVNNQWVNQRSVYSNRSRLAV